MHINNANKRARPSPLGQIKWQSLFTALPGDGRCLLWWRRGLMSLLLRLRYLSFSPLRLPSSGSVSSPAEGPWLQHAVLPLVIGRQSYGGLVLLELVSHGVALCWAHCSTLRLSPVIKCRGEPFRSDNWAEQFWRGGGGMSLGKIGTLRDCFSVFSWARSGIKHVSVQLLLAMYSVKYSLIVSFCVKALHWWTAGHYSWFKLRVWLWLFS